MAINALSYIGVNSDRIEDWSDYSRKCLGMQQVDRAKDSLSFRMDDQKQRISTTKKDNEPLTIGSKLMSFHSLKHLLAKKL